jgi:hypothetical protein
MPPGPSSWPTFSRVAKTSCRSKLSSCKGLGDVIASRWPNCQTPLGWHTHCAKKCQVLPWCFSTNSFSTKQAHRDFT